MRSKRHTLALLGAVLFGFLATTVQASAPRVIMIEDFDATN